MRGMFRHALLSTPATAGVSARASMSASWRAESTQHADRIKRFDGAELFARVERFDGAER
jgi:hypothetical protein